jgi:hypothetical protein
MYPDRLLIRNPGGLFGAVSEDELGIEGVSSSRSSVLSALLQEVNPGQVELSAADIVKATGLSRASVLRYAEVGRSSS